jgi:hypothetical protein
MCLPQYTQADLVKVLRDLSLFIPAGGVAKIG